MILKAIQNIKGKRIFNRHIECSHKGQWKKSKSMHWNRSLGPESHRKYCAASLNNGNFLESKWNDKTNEDSKEKRTWKMKKEKAHQPHGKTEITLKFMAENEDENIKILLKCFIFWMVDARKCVVVHSLLCVCVLANERVCGCERACLFFCI